MQRLLLLMGSTTYKAHDFLSAARQLGVEVVVGSDRRPALEERALGTSLPLDFQHPEQALDTIVKFAARSPFTAVIGADDDAVPLAAQAAQALSLPHNPVAAVAATRNKLRLRQLLSQAGVPSPQYTAATIDYDPAAVARGIRFPCVLKPLFLAGSRGVIRADDPAQFGAAFQRLAALLQVPEVMAQGGEMARQILVEDFIAGQEVAVEGVLCQGELRLLALFDKPDPLEGPFFEETIYVTPSRLPVATQQEIAACTGRAARGLGLREGPVHAELRLNAQGAWPLDIAARTIGGLCSRTLRFGSGISLEELVLRHAIGLDVTRLKRDTQAAGVMMLPIPRPGMLRQIEGQEAARGVPGIEGLTINAPIGHEVVPLPEGASYLGFLFARAATPEQVEAALREAHKRLTIVITPPG